MHLLPFGGGKEKKVRYTILNVYKTLRSDDYLQIRQEAPVKVREGVAVRIRA